MALEPGSAALDQLVRITDRGYDVRPRIGIGSCTYGLEAQRTIPERDIVDRSINLRLVAQTLIGFGGTSGRQMRTPGVRN